MCLQDSYKNKTAGGGGNVVDADKLRGAISPAAVAGGNDKPSTRTPVTKNGPVPSDGSSDESSSRMPTGRAFLLLLISLPLSYWFSHEFPHMLSEKAAHYYELTNFRYDAQHTRFDNSAWTYVTDYVITLFMTYGSIVMLRLRNDCARRRVAETCPQLRHLQAVCGGTSALLASYAVSVLAGGLSHQHFTTISSLNSTNFRVMWSIVVGAVAAASGFMGYIGSSLGLYFNSSPSNKQYIRFHVPVLPTWFWVVWGVGMTGAVLVGGMSFYRPACDIFIAGTSQFFSTAYAVLTILSRRFGDSAGKRKGDRAADPQKRKGDSKDGITEPLLAEKTTGIKDGVGAGGAKSVSKTPDSSSATTTVDFQAVDKRTIALFVAGFFGNAPLLPMYPELLHTSLDLGVVNTILHCWLCVTWGMQFLALRRIYLSQSQR